MNVHFTSVMGSSLSKFVAEVKYGLSICIRLYGGLDWPDLAGDALEGT